MSVNDIIHSEVRLFVQDGHMTCLCTNLAHQKRQTCQSKLSHQVQNELKSGIKHDNIFFQVHLQQSDNSCSSQMFKLVLSMYVRTYLPVQQNISTATTTSITSQKKSIAFNFYVSKDMLQWMLGGELCTLDAETEDDTSRSFSLPLFLRQVSDRPLGSFHSQSVQQGQQHQDEEGHEKAARATAIATAIATATEEETLQQQLLTLGMLPSLRPYQLQAILWMKRREGTQHTSASPTLSERRGCQTERITANTQGFVLLPSSHHRRHYRATGAGAGALQSTVAVGHWVCYEVDSTASGTPADQQEDSAREATSLLDVQCTRGEEGEEEEEEESAVWFNTLTGKAMVFRDRTLHFSSSSSGSGHHKNYQQSIVEKMSQNCSPVVSGGMLCDEPGLGKTLEVLGLVLMDKAKNQTPCHEVNTASSALPVSPEGKESSQPDTTSTSRPTASAADVACVCMRTSYRPKLHLGWVQCDVCDRYCHITCAGKWDSRLRLYSISESFILL